MPTNSPNTEGGTGEKLSEQLRRIAQARGRLQRSSAIDDLATLLQNNRSASIYLQRMADGERHGQRLALEVVLRLALPLDEPTCRVVIPLLANDQHPAPLRLNAAIQVLQSLPADSPLINQLLARLTESQSPLRAVERLRFLALHVPGHPAVAPMISALEEETAIPCPRCGARMQRPELIVHLWEAHRLMMEGSRARDPWKMIEDWLAEYEKTGSQQLLERSCELGQQLDPVEGLTRVHRLLLKAGLTDEEASENLTGQAAGRRASLCPYCYALVPPVNDPLPRPMNISRGRIAGNGCTIEVSDRYLFTRLYAASPDKVLYDGREPNRVLTQRGQALFQTGPLVLVAVATALLFPPDLLAPLTPVSLILLAALVVYVRIRKRHDTAGEPGRRAINHAWRLLAPRMHLPDFKRKDARFLARLAMTSRGYGSPDLRARPLERCVHLTERAVQEHATPCRDLAALRCLEIDDAPHLDRDAIPILVNDLVDCLLGRYPLDYAEQILESLPQAQRDRGQAARLRVLFCQAAFEHGFEARDLHDLGHISTILGQGYASEDLKGLSRLHWLWINRPARIWQKNGSASTVFDLARFPALAQQYLTPRPDLLLFQPMSIGTGPESGAPILICEEGVLYRDIMIRGPDTPVAIKPRGNGEFELAIGKSKLVFAADPTLLSTRLQGWAQFLFHELLPGARELAGHRNPLKLKPLARQKTIICPECRHSFLALRGEVGMFAGYD